MSFTNRDRIAWLLLASAAVCLACFLQLKIRTDAGAAAATVEDSNPPTSVGEGEYATIVRVEDPLPLTSDWEGDGPYLSFVPEDPQQATTWPAYYKTVPETVPDSGESAVTSDDPDSGEPVSASAAEEEGTVFEVPPDAEPYPVLRTVLLITGTAAALTGVFLLRQKKPLSGPDGVFLLCAAVLLFVLFFFMGNYRPSFRAAFRILYDSTASSVPLTALLFFAALCGLRELFGWLYSGCSLSWCIAARGGTRSGSLRRRFRFLLIWTGALLVSAVLSCVFVIVLTVLYGRLPGPAGCQFLLLCAALLPALLCLCRFGGDMAHFERQLAAFLRGEEIQIRTGAFSNAEARLEEIRTRHAEAVRTAVADERFKVDLITNVSHDLRTPLTSILGYGELLQNEALSEEGRLQLKKLNQKAGYMSELVESLFELTKVSSGVIACRRESIDLVRLLEQTIGLFDDRLTETGLVIRRRYDADSVPLLSDGAMLHRVFANLIGNAVKYALEGSRIWLEVRTLPQEVLVRIVNTSSYEMDFTPEEVMQRFVRGDRARSTQGSGLGLAIAQTYTEAVGGSFSVSIDGDQFSALVRLPGSGHAPAAGDTAGEP